MWREGVVVGVWVGGDELLDMRTGFFPGFVCGGGQLGKTGDLV